MLDFPPIGDHGIIGDLRTCALVSADGDIDWFCPGRFDEPSVFASLLDQELGGRFRVSVEGATQGKQLYLPDTAVLTTRFAGTYGVGEVIDFMPVRSGQHNQIVRILRAVRGAPQFTVECRPRSGATPVHLTSSFPLDRDGDDWTGSITLTTGETAALMLSTEEHEHDDLLADAHSLRRATAAFWREWLSTSNYRGRWPDTVHRSAITLKLLIHAPTGAPVAAATTSLPEEIGGERNWDYRYTWIRDGSFTVRALRDLGFVAEANAFAGWVSERLRNRDPEAEEPLRIMYRVDGSTDLDETTQPEWSGYQGSFPVRVGNGAADQLQLDIYGELLFSLAGTTFPVEDTAAILDWLTANWDRPDEGVWETRGGRRDFTFSRLMCWTAFDRGLAMAPDHPSAALWRAAREEIAEQIHTHGWDDETGAYIQRYGDRALDASILFMPYVGFIAPDDPRWLSTMRAINQDLSWDGLIYRYRTTEFYDGMRGEESSFDLCSLLFHIALAQAGDVERARWEFTKFLSHAGPTGLFSEELAPDGVQLGNVPQAFTHLGVIWAALALDEALDKAPVGAALSSGFDGGIGSGLSWPPGSVVGMGLGSGIDSGLDSRLGSDLGSDLGSPLEGVPLS